MAVLDFTKGIERDRFASSVIISKLCSYDIAVFILNPMFHFGSNS